MSEALKTCITERLNGVEIINPTLYPTCANAQTNLLALLATDVRMNNGNGAGAVYNGKWYTKIPTPCICFLFDTGLGHDNFSQSGVVEDVYVDFTYYANDTTLLDAIFGYSERLLDYRFGRNIGIPALPYPIGTGEVKWVDCFLPKTDAFQQSTEVWFVKSRYKFLECRY